MRILHRQIFKEILSHGLLGLVLFTFVLFLRDTTRLLELILRDTAVWRQVAYLTLLAFPPALAFTLPMAVLLGTLIGLSRMSADGEITALRAAGVSTRMLLPPLLTFALLGSGLALIFSAYAAPAASRERVLAEREIGLRQIASQLKPRVFEERFPNLILYVQDAIAGPQPAWKGIFLADLTNPARPKITLAKDGVLFNDAEYGQLQLHLSQGTVHETGSTPGEYSIASFESTDIPVRLPAPSPSAVKPNVQRTNAELYAMSQAALADADSVEAHMEPHIELHRRFALPMAAFFLALIAIPLGLAAHKGGKSSGIILTILMVGGYYSLFIGGISLARAGTVAIWAGVWGANFFFGALGVYMLSRADRVSPLSDRLVMFAEWLPDTLRRIAKAVSRKSHAGERESSSALGGLRNGMPGPLILDRYILRSFLLYLVITVAALVLLIEIVTLFLDLLSDVIEHQIPASMVADYFLHLTPHLIYVITPLGVLVAVLVSFAILSQNNEVTAAKASGISLYRLTAPVLAAAAALSVGLFFFEYYLVPVANRHQDAVRDRIKGRPAQTYLRPDRQWIVGEGSRIYYYNFFEPNEQVLGGVTIFEFDPATYELKRRFSAERATYMQTPSGSGPGWVFSSGWERDFREPPLDISAGMSGAGEASGVAEAPGAAEAPGMIDSVHFEQFEMRAYPELREPPAYFLKEVKQTTQMNSTELRSYIDDLQKSGFDVVPLAVQLQRKFSFPLFVPIMALIGLPFAFSMGKRGALTGIAVSLGIAMAFWATTSLFEAIGNLNQLPPIAAAWSPNLLFGLGGLYFFLRIRT
ncbi:MAG: YjgP/YjgQ family permease [Acidobacteria bacterium]|nr:YjgP/YjgQ family permease [Acidobacteriota bacterium]